MKKSPWLAILFPVGLFAILFCTVGDAFFPPIHRLLHHNAAWFPDDAAGTVTSAGEAGNWTMQVNACYSGERKQFYGVEFYDEKQPALGGQIVLTPGVKEQVSLNEGPGKSGSVYWTREMCTVWDMDVQRTNTSYNRITAVAGHARFECHDLDSRVSGNLTFHECH